MLFFGLLHLLNHQHSKIISIYRMLFVTAIVSETIVFLVYWIVLSWHHIPKYVSSCSHPFWCHVFNFLTHVLPVLATWIPLCVEPIYIHKTDFLSVLVYFCIFLSIHIPYALLHGPVYPGGDFKRWYGWVLILVIISILFGTFKLVKWVSETMRIKNAYKLGKQIEVVFN